jgi:hypothetical protein
MLQKLGDHIQSCLERADQCQAAAALESNADIKAQLLSLETQWRHVATTYEFVVSLEKFLMDQQKHTLPHEVEQLPKDQP